MSPAGLAPDPFFARRDDLLDSAALRARLSALLGVEAESCERVRAAYHPGRSLRVLVRVRFGGRTVALAGRMFPAGASGAPFEQARARGGAVLHDEELATVFTVFPF